MTIARWRSDHEHDRNAREVRDRSQVDGDAREKHMTVFNRFHGKIMARVVTVLMNWLDGRSEREGEVLCGEVGIGVYGHPERTVGVDVAYVPRNVAGGQLEESPGREATPALAAEILGGNDTFGEINEKITGYLSAGVPHVWIIDPYQRTLVVHRPNQPSVLLNPPDEVAAEPQLPGFRTSVFRLFE
jgi:Uma2 family endonuclease